MTENAETPAVQDEQPSEPTGPALLSEEWVEKTLKDAGVQDEPSEEAPVAATEQGEQPEATNEETPAEPAAAPNWREAAIPTDDDTVPQHFRGKSANDVWDSYRELESTWNKDRQHMRELEAKVAAQETVREMLGEKPADPQAPTDQYQEAGIDLETTPVLDPKTFYPKQQELILAKAKEMFEAEMDKRAAATTAEQQQQAAVDNVAAAISHVEKERGLDVATMKDHIPSMLMKANELFGQDAVGDPAKLLQVHDALWPQQQPVAAPEPIPTTKPVPNPPGAKVPKIVEPGKATPGVQLKDYERDILNDLETAMRNNLSPDIAAGINGDRLRARYAANLKKVRG